MRKKLKEFDPDQFDDFLTQVLDSPAIPDTFFNENFNFLEESDTSAGIIESLYITGHSPDEAAEKLVQIIKILYY